MNREARLQRLVPRVTSYARTIAARHGLAADEVEQEMWVAILSHADRYDDRNLLVKAGLDARRQVQRQGKTARYLPRTAQVVRDYPQEFSSQDDNFIDGVVDVTADGTEAQALRGAALTSAGNLRAQVRRTVAGLRGVRREVATGLMSEQRPGEIAEELSVSRPAVSYHIRKLRAAFEPYRSLCEAM